MMVLAIMLDGVSGQKPMAIKTVWQGVPAIGLRLMTNLQILGLR
jgi:hypothetical protein